MSKGPNKEKTKDVRKVKVSIKKRPKTEVEGEDGDEIKKLSGLGAGENVER